MLNDGLTTTVSSIIMAYARNRDLALSQNSDICEDTVCLCDNAVLHSVILCPRHQNLLINSVDDPLRKIKQNSIIRDFSRFLDAINKSDVTLRIQLYNVAIHVFIYLYVKLICERKDVSRFYSSFVSKLKVHEHSHNISMLSSVTTFEDFKHSKINLKKQVSLSSECLQLLKRLVSCSGTIAYATSQLNITCTHPGHSSSTLIAPSTSASLEAFDPSVDTSSICAYCIHCHLTSAVITHDSENVIGSMCRPRDLAGDSENGIGSMCESRDLGQEPSGLYVWSLTERSLTTSGGVDRNYMCRLVGHSGHVYSVCSVPSNTSHVLTAGFDGDVILWSGAENWNNVQLYRSHRYPVWCVSTCNDQYFVTSSMDRTAQLWSYQRPFPVRVFAGHSLDVNCACIHSNNNYVCTSSSDRSVRVWDVNSALQVRLISQERGCARNMCVSPDGKLLAVSGESSEVCVFDIAEGRLCTQLHTEGSTSGRHAVNTLLWSPCGRRLLAGDRSGVISVWNMSGSSSCSRVDTLCGDNSPTSLIASYKYPDCDSVVSLSHNQHNYVSAILSAETM